MTLANTPNAMKHRAYAVAYSRALHSFVNYYRFALYGRDKYVLEFFRALVKCGFTNEEAHLECAERCDECERMNRVLDQPPYRNQTRVGPADFPCLWP